MIENIQINLCNLTSTINFYSSYTQNRFIEYFRITKNWNYALKFKLNLEKIGREKFVLQFDASTSRAVDRKVYMLVS